MIEEPKKKKGAGSGRTGTFNPIGWCHFTLNFWWGCTEVSPACAHCYARTQAGIRSKMFFGFTVEWGKGKPRGERLERARIEALALDRQAKKKGVRYRVFVNSMSDWLDEEVPIEWLAFLLETIFLCPHLDFQLLTKRPGNFHSRISAIKLKGVNPEFDAWLFAWFLAAHREYGAPEELAVAPENVWVGTTVENQEWADRRVPELLNIPARVRFLSCEPLLGPVDLLIDGEASSWACPECGSRAVNPDNSDRDEGKWWECRDCKANEFGEPLWAPLIHQVIAGGESGGHARPSHPEWFRSLRDQCQAAGVPFYFKQWGEWVPVHDHPAQDLPVTHKGHRFPDGTLMLRAGTKRAGSLLEGEEWKQFPEGAKDAEMALA